MCEWRVVVATSRVLLAPMSYRPHSILPLRAATSTAPLPLACSTPRQAQGGAGLDLKFLWEGGQSIRMQAVEVAPNEAAQVKLKYPLQDKHPSPAPPTLHSVIPPQPLTITSPLSSPLQCTKGKCTHQTFCVQVAGSFYQPCGKGEPWAQPGWCLSRRVQGSGGCVCRAGSGG